jgi:hypothetical protein
MRQRINDVTAPRAIGPEQRDDEIGAFERQFDDL